MSNVLFYPSAVLNAVMSYFPCLKCDLQLVPPSERMWSATRNTLLENGLRNVDVPVRPDLQLMKHEATLTVVYKF